MDHKLISNPIAPNDTYYPGDSSKEQYMLLQGYDYFDHPKFTIRWR